MAIESMTIFIEVGRDKQSPLCLGHFEMVLLLLARFLDTGLPGITFLRLSFLRVIVQRPGTRSSPGNRCPIEAIVCWKEQSIYFSNCQPFRGAWSSGLLSAYPLPLPHTGECLVWSSRITPGHQSFQFTFYLRISWKSFLTPLLKLADKGCGEYWES